MYNGLRLEIESHCVGGGIACAGYGGRQPSIAAVLFLLLPKTTELTFCKAPGIRCLFILLQKILYLVLPNISTPYLHIIKLLGGELLKHRKLALGTRNIVGARVTEARHQRGMKQVELLAKLQLAGVEMSIPALSLLEGQKRPVSDLELNALADIFQVSADWLLGRE